MSYPRLFTTPGLGALAEELDAERGRQLTKWGDQHHPDGTNPLNRDYANDCKARCARAAAEHRVTWSHILVEEVAEALAETDWPLLRVELVQVMAVCAAWISDGERRHDAEAAAKPKCLRCRTADARYLDEYDDPFCPDCAHVLEGRRHGLPMRPIEEAPRA